MTTTDTHLLLEGPDGANPLGFLCAVGTLLVACEFQPSARLSWQETGTAWRPVIHGCGHDPETFIQRIHETLQALSMDAFEIDQKLPFLASTLHDAMVHEREKCTPDTRRTADFLCGFGSEVLVDKNGIFESSSLVVVRSGDSNGQGLPTYAKAIRTATELDHIRRTLFKTWDYRDSGFSLRFDPIEDQPYALRWRDPQKSSIADGPGTMLAADALAVEAFRVFPSFPIGKQLSTTGFNHFRDGSIPFSWPVWKHPSSPDMLRTLLAIPELQRPHPDSSHLAKRGIATVFRSQRTKQNKYYSVLAPSVPV